jgi:hypothetical protein
MNGIGDSTARTASFNLHDVRLDFSQEDDRFLSLTLWSTTPKCVVSCDEPIVSSIKACGYTQPCLQLGMLHV